MTQNGKKIEEIKMGAKVANEMIEKGSIRPHSPDKDEFAHFGHL